MLSCVIGTINKVTRFVAEIQTDKLTRTTQILLDLVLGVFNFGLLEYWVVECRGFPMFGFLDDQSFD